MNSIQLHRLAWAASLVLACLLSACSNNAQEWAYGDRLKKDGKFQRGYLQARSDAAKQEYWRREQAERNPATPAEGRTVYYTFPGPAETADGVQNHPSTVTVPIVE